MNEVKQVYYDDLREKKSIKNSASKTNRTGKGPIRFPSDYMSKKEKAQMNGECRSWKYSEFPDRNAFNKMSDDIKIEYLNWIINTYGVGLSPISKYVFNQAASAVHTWLKNHPEVDMYVNHPSKGTVAKRHDVERLIKDVEKAREPKPIKLEAPTKNEAPSESVDFTEEEKEFISRYLAPISESKKEPEVVASPIEETVEHIMAEAPRMSSMEFGMDGFDFSFLEMIAKRFGDQKVRVNVSIYVEESMNG